MKLSDIQTFPDPAVHPMSDEAFLRQHAQVHSRFARNGELYHALEMTSFFVDTHRDITAAQTSVPAHRHSFYELLYCRSASHVDYLVGKEQHRLQRGDIIFICPGVPHQPLFPEPMEEPYIRDVIWMSQEFFTTVVTTLMPHALDSDPSGLYRLEGISGASIGELFRRGVLEAEAKEPCWETAVVANTLAILALLNRAVSREKPTVRTDLLDQILAYVELHWSEKITMADVAGHFFISESTITQTFRSKLGVSFYRFVTRRRLMAAQDLIEQGIPLETVAERTGFSDYSAFFRAFKQEYGMSPRQYRKGLTEKP